jgi:hypothetical protein
VGASRVIDVDGHVFEPDELWEQHLPPELHDRRPRLVRDDRGTTRYELEGHQIPPGTGVGAWVPEGIQEASVHRDGAIDPHLRLQDMDTEGIDVAILYGTASLGFWGIVEPELARGCCRAYNDWLAEYCAADPARLKGTPALPLGSLDDAVAEARRAVTELGFVSLTVPCCVGPRNLDDPGFDDLWRLAAELDVPVGVHAGGPRFAHRRFVDSYATLHALEFPFDIMFAAATLVCGGVVERWPTLRLLLLEAGAAWGPYLFDRLDEHYEKRPHEMPRISKPPSEYLLDGRVVISCEAERYLAHALDGLGSQTVVFASDYPHWDAEYPNSVRAIAERTDLDDRQKEAILGANAERIYGWASP